MRVLFFPLVLQSSRAGFRF